MQVLTGEEYSAWLVKHKEAEAAMDDREIKLRGSAWRIEADLDLLGIAQIFCVHFRSEIVLWKECPQKRLKVDKWRLFSSPLTNKAVLARPPW